MIETMTLHQASKYLRDKGLSLCSDTLADGLEQACTPSACVHPHRPRRVFQILKEAGCVDRGAGGVNMDGYTLTFVIIGAATVSYWLMRLVDKLDGSNTNGGKDDVFV